MKATLDTLGLGATAALPPEKQAERMQVLALVQQFEGMLLTEMLRDVDTGSDDDEAMALGGSTLTDMMQGEFGQALSKSGGMGLRQMLADALLRHDASAAALGVGAVSASASTPATLPVTLPAAVPTGASRSGAAVDSADRATDVVAADVPTTSAFGWRSDPFTGKSSFHRGVDLALAYGSEVRSVGPGVVASAGERSGYGLTVVVDHGNGRETLYAHLSSIAVVEGQAVGAGQRIAQSGNSGRATGAHLHFEAREFGRPVDAGRLAAGWAGRPADAGVGIPDEIRSGG